MTEEPQRTPEMEETHPLGLDEFRSYPRDTEAPDERSASMEVYIGETGAMVAHGLLAPDGADQATRPNPYPFIRGLVDVRHLMARRSDGGPKTRRQIQSKDPHVIGHYAGGPQNRAISALDRLISYSRWHIRPNGFGAGATGDGIMYVIGIAEDGTKYLTNDIELDRWHCGSWPENSGIGVNFPVGEGQSLTPQQIKSGGEVMLDWIAYRGVSRSYIKGHNEVGNSPCPGPIIMRTLIVPLRNGQTPGGETVATKYYFVYGGAPAQKIADAAEAALESVGMNKGRVASLGVPSKPGRDGEADIDWIAEHALDGYLGQYPTTLVGSAVLDKIPARVRESLKDDSGNWHDPKESDLWRGSTIEEVSEAVERVAKLEKKDSKKALTEFERLMVGIPGGPEEPTKPASWEIPTAADPKVVADVTKAGAVVGRFEPGKA